MKPIDSAQLTGQTESHLAALSGRSVLLHAEVVAEFQLLRQQAAHEGFDLQVASGFRSFDRQLAIWNAKASGGRLVLDHGGKPVDIAALSPLQLVHTIMRWSALPGASRHHWGTDFDIWDRAAVPADYQLQLVPEEYGPDGPFGPLSQWLERQMASGGCPFFRPYAEDRGGIAPELWHLSYHPVADGYASALTPAVLVEVLSGTELELKSTVLAHLDELYERYISL